MSISSDAELVYGWPVLAFDEESGEATPFWDEEEEDWRDFEHLAAQTYGHYEDPGNERGILSFKGLASFQADCWTAERIPVSSMPLPRLSLLVNGCAEAAALGLDSAAGPAWYLVASVG